MAYGNWNATPANNNSTPPHGFPEGMAASALNNGIRQLMADLATMRDALAAGSFFTGDLDLSNANSLTLLDGSVTTDKVTDANITGPKVADNAISLAKQAHGTQGGIPYYGVSGAPTELAAGTAGKFLMTNGASQDPSYEVIPLPTGFAQGCTISLNSSDSDHDIDITAGLHRDSTDTIDITSAADTVQCDVVFGTNDGILESGSLANSTSYYLYTITKAAGADQKYFLFTGSDPSSDLPADYVYWAALNDGNPIKTDSSANLFDFFHGKFKSENFTYTNSSTVNVTHPLGERPFNFVLWAQCTTTQSFITLGDHLEVGTGDSSGASYGYTVIPSTTGFKLVVGAGIIQGSAVLTPGNFELYYTAETRAA